MLKINQELLEIDDAVDQLVAALINRPELQHYLAVKARFDQDHSLSQAMAEFRWLKQDFEAVEAYASYRPEIGQLKRKLLKKKRELDLNPLIQDLRQSEHEVQELLAKLTQEISQAFAEDIFVDTGLPFAPSKRPHGHGPGQNIRERGQD